MVRDADSSNVPVNLTLHVKGRFRDLCRCCEMKDFACPRMRSDGSVNGREISVQRDALDSTNSLHERQTHAMLYGAVLSKKSEVGFLTAGEDVASGVGRRRVNMRRNMSVGSLWIKTDFPASGFASRLSKDENVFILANSPESFEHLSETLRTFMVRITLKMLFKRLTLRTSLKS